MLTVTVHFSFVHPYIYKTKYPLIHATPSALECIAEETFTSSWSAVVCIVSVEHLTCPV